MGKATELILWPYPYPILPKTKTTLGGIMFILNQAVQTSSSSGSGAFVILSIVILIFLKLISSALKEKPQNRPAPRYPNQGSRPRQAPKRSAFFPSQQEIAEFNPDNLRVFGIPGKGLQNASNFSDANIQSGIVGEQKTAAILDRFVQQSTNCYVFHSMQWPLSSTEADVDHVIVCGHNILLIDSKNWRKNGVYAFNWEGDIAVDGTTFPFGRKPKIIAALGKYHDYTRELFGNFDYIKISSVTVIHNNRSDVKPGSYAGVNYLATGETLDKFIREWELGLGIVEDDKRLLCSIHSLLK